LTGSSTATPVDPLVGKSLGGRYRIGRELGRGGMGVVYEALQKELDRRVAIKVLFQSGEPQSEERLLREARAAGSIGHPNVVDVYDLGRLPDGRPYVVMPLLEGHDVAVELSERGLPTIERALWIVTQAASGLDVLHAKGLVHRDLKPENLFLVRHVDGSEVVKILDFGLAARIEDVRLTHTGFATGSPHYMPPEAADGSMPDKRGDIYSLASVAYELLTGTTPFDGDSAFQILTHKTTRAAPPLETSGRSFSSEAQAAMARGLAMDPRERFETAGTFAGTLARALTCGGGAPLRSAGQKAPRETIEVESPLFDPEPAPFELVVEGTGPAAAGDDEASATRATTGGAAARAREPKLSSSETGLTRVPTRRGPLVIAGMGALGVLAGAAALAWLWSRPPAPADTVASDGRGGRTTAETPLAPAAPGANAVAPPHDDEPAGRAATATSETAPTTATETALGIEAPRPGSRTTRAPAHSGTAAQGAHGAGGATAAIATPAVTPISAPTVAPPPAPTPTTETSDAPSPAHTARSTPPAPDAPDLARAQELNRTATRMLVQGALGDALSGFRDATLAAPRYAPAWRGLGLANERLGRNPEALRAYRRYLEIAPSAPDAAEIRERVARVGG